MLRACRCCCNASRRGVRKANLGESGKRVAVGCSDRDTALRPRVEVPQFHVENGGLHSIETRVSSLEFMVVLGFPSVVRDHEAALGQGSVAHQDRAGAAIGAEVFPRIETEAGDVADGADSGTVAFCAMGLGAILDNAKTELAGETHH